MAALCCIHSAVRVGRYGRLLENAFRFFQTPFYAFRSLLVDISREGATRISQRSEYSVIRLLAARPAVEVREDSRRESTTVPTLQFVLDNLGFRESLGASALSGGAGGAVRGKLEGHAIDTGPGHPSTGGHKSVRSSAIIVAVR